MPKKEEGGGFGVASFVLGLLSFLGAILFFLALPAAILGIIFSILQFRKQKTGLAITGLIFSILGFLASSAVAVLFVFFYGFISTNLDIQDLDVERSIVLVKTSTDYINLENLRYKGPGEGSGVIYAEENNKLYILINRHVIDCVYSYQCSRIINRTINVMMHNGKIYPILKTYIAPHKVDLAILEIESPQDRNYTIASLRENINQSELILAIGYPAFSLGARQYSKRGGKVTGFRELITDEGFKFKVIDSDAFISFGSSGGGLFDSQGNLVGVTTWGDDSNNAYAISVNVIGNKNTFKTCNEGTYFTDEGCAEFCDGVLSSDLKCSRPCTDFYCNSKKIKGSDEFCQNGFIIGTDGFCHPPCGSADTYCAGVGNYCYENQCVTCPYGYRLYDDGKCY